MSETEKLILENQIMIMKVLLNNMHPGRNYDELRNKIIETQNKILMR